MKNEKLVGITSIAYKDNCSLQILNIKKSGHYYVDFYNVYVEDKKDKDRHANFDGVYFIDRIELGTFEGELGYQLINNKLVIYSYNSVQGRRYHAVTNIFKYYDVIDNISINASAKEIISELGFDLPEEEKRKIELVSTKKRKLDEHIRYLEEQIDSTHIIPMVNMCEEYKNYFNKHAYSKQMIHPIKREVFARYYTRLITGSSDPIIVNKPIINIDDYNKGKSRK